MAKKEGRDGTRLGNRKTKSLYFGWGLRLGQFKNLVATNIYLLDIEASFGLSYVLQTDRYAVLIRKSFPWIQVSPFILEAKCLETEYNHGITSRRENSTEQK